MAGIYIHIPFCKRACHYCNFHFSTSFQKKDELVSALLEEIKLQAGYVGGQSIGTLYFGGGTPSALPPDDIKNILQTIHLYHTVETGAEITLEANPDDIDENNLDAWKEMGINRLSIGIQAFQDDLLFAWNRNHTAQQALASLSLAKEAGFDNITADLIYGAPGLTDLDWMDNITRLIDSGIPHISAYALTIEAGTVLHHQIRKGITKTPDDEQSHRQFLILQKMLKSAGYEQYEISNFSKSGFRSRHNTSYWAGTHYLGIGPAAHSFNGISRQWNVPNNIKYTHALRNKVIPFEIEILTQHQKYNELVMTGLRTSSGIDMKAVRELENGAEVFLREEIKEFIDQGKIKINEKGNFVLNPEYYFFADGIASALFKV